MYDMKLYLDKDRQHTAQNVAVTLVTVTKLFICVHQHCLVLPVRMLMVMVTGCIPSHPVVSYAWQVICQVSENAHFTLMCKLSKTC
jgi:hypothetical protein